MQNSILVALILGVSLIVAAFLASGRYGMSTHGHLYDRFTGHVWECAGAECDTAEFDPPLVTGTPDKSKSPKN
jgi:hypothetical protein